MLEAIIKQAWNLTERIRQVIARIPIILYRSNRKVHRWINKFLGDGIVALLSTAMTCILGIIVYISVTYQYTLPRLFDAFGLILKISIDTKRVGVW